MDANASIPERVVAKVLDRIAMGPDGCHISLLSAHGGGYAQVSWTDERGVIHRGLAHRLRWAIANGWPDSELTVHHKCHRRRCVNLHHLDLIPRGENARRRTVGVEETPFGGCIHNHGPERWRSVGGRSWCAECDRLRQARNRHRRNARRRELYRAEREA